MNDDDDGDVEDYDITGKNTRKLLQVKIKLKIALIKNQMFYTCLFDRGLQICDSTFQAPTKADLNASNNKMLEVVLPQLSDRYFNTLAL